MELALATRRPSASVSSASTKATRLPPEITRDVQVSMPPGRTGARKLTFISALAEKTFRPLAQVTVAAPMAESQHAARNPPWSTPTGLVKRSSAGICQTVVPGLGLVHADHAQGEIAIGRDLHLGIGHGDTVRPACPGHEPTPPAPSSGPPP